MNLHRSLQANKASTPRDYQDPLSPPTPQGNMQRTNSQDSTADSLRKRVCKACDRCRMKKSKCDGATPCSRCRADDQICVFGERKRSHDKVYPKGYVEQLEAQQRQMMDGISEMYHRALNAGHWEGPALNENEGKPLVHDVLAALGVLAESKTSDECEPFEEDFQKLQTRLVNSGAPLVHRRGSVSSESDRGHQHPPPQTTSWSTSNITPQETSRHRKIFRESFAISSASHSPLALSPTQRTVSPTAPPPQPQWQQPNQSSQTVAMNNDPQPYAPDWQQVLASNSATGHYPAYDPNIQMDMMRQPGQDVMMGYTNDFQQPMNFDVLPSFTGQNHPAFNNFGGFNGALNGLGDLTEDNFDMAKYVQQNEQLMI